MCERGREIMCVYVGGEGGEIVCVCEREREIVCVCVCVRERET